MAIKKAQQDLRPEGRYPDTEPGLAQVLADAWAATVDEGPKAMASSEARVRHSWAGFCARRLGYEIRGDEVSEPLSVADHWRFGTGTVIHERWQEVVAQAWPDAEVEKQVTIDDIPSAGHIDLFIADPVPVAVELKTINGFGFKQAIGARGTPEGPRTSAVTQGALNAHAAGAEVMKVIYLSLENLSPRELQKIGLHEWQRFAAEWTYERDEWEPIADAEISRFKKALEFVDSGKLPPRAIPDLPKGARITNPQTGAWTVTTADGITDTGSTWQCAYCPFRSRCTDDGA